MADAIIPTTPSCVVTLKLRLEEHALLRHTADGLGIGLGPSSYAADAVRRSLGTERRRPIPVPRNDLTDPVRDVTGAIGRLGNLGNGQILLGDRASQDGKAGFVVGVEGEINRDAALTQKDPAFSIRDARVRP